jgi:hypothetical protein
MIVDEGYRYEDIFDMSQQVTFNGIDYVIFNKSKFETLWCG